MAEEIIETPENKTFNHVIKENNLTTSNILLHFACLDYISTYKSNMVPFNYIEYFIKYVSTYENLFKTDLVNFYKDFDINNIDIELLATIYSKDMISIVVTVVKKDSIEFIVTDENPIDLLTYYMESETNDSVRKVIYSNIKLIIDNMNQSDQLISKKAMYEKYMINKFLDSYNLDNIKTNINTTDNIINDESKIISTQNELNDSNTPSTPLMEDKELKGKEIEVPEQKGKVVKLFIPKLLLPSPYPVLQDTSRINSDYKAKKLTKADKLLTIFDKYKFKAVIYSTGFIGKRKKVKKPKPKFSFDF